MLATNLTGPFLCCQHSYSLLRDGGRIVLLGSLSGRTGGVLTGAAYAATKGGIESLAKSMAQELAPRGITVNVIAPGAIETPMLRAHTIERQQGMAAATPLKRLGQPEEIAGAVVYLASADARGDQFVHVENIYGVVHGALISDGDHRDSVRATRGCDARAINGVNRNIALRAIAIAHSFAIEKHRGFVFFTFTNDDCSGKIYRG
jgi:NAD(P)-dependent dehydrogenase (short-subunit alcohol dehydrogenase family)